MDLTSETFKIEGRIYRRTRKAGQVTISTADGLEWVSVGVRGPSRHVTNQKVFEQMIVDLLNHPTELGLIDADVGLITQFLKKAGL